MVTAFVMVDGRMHKTEMSAGTYARFRTNTLRKYLKTSDVLRKIVKRYGALTEANIIAYMNEEGWRN